MLASKTRNARFPLEICPQCLPTNAQVCSLKPAGDAFGARHKITLSFSPTSPHFVIIYSDGFSAVLLLGKALQPSCTPTQKQGLAQQLCSACGCAWTVPMIQTWPCGPKRDASCFPGAHTALHLATCYIHMLFYSEKQRI